MTFGEAVKQRRMALGWSQQDLADISDSHVRTVQNAEEGKLMSDRTIFRLAKHLGLPLEDVMPADGNMTIGKWMQLNRRRKGLSRQELADMAQITLPTLACAERDEHGLNIYSMIQLARVLGIGIDEYIGGKTPT